MFKKPALAKMIRKLVLLIVASSLISKGNCGFDDGVSVTDWDTVRTTYNALNLLKNVASNADPTVIVPNTIPLTINISDRNPSTCVTKGDNGAKFNGYRVYSHNGTSDVIALYDVKGSFSGISTRFPVSEVTQHGNFNHQKVPMFQRETANNVQYFVLTAYTRDPSTICTTGTNPASRPPSELVGNILLFQNGPDPTNVLLGPKRRNDALAAKYSNGNCLMGMGQHTFYNVENWATANCTEILPAFLLQDKHGYLVGFGWTWTGISDSSYFEHPPLLVIKNIVGNMVPQCVDDLYNKNKSGVGVTSLHVFFTKKTTFCGPTLSLDQVQKKLEIFDKKSGKTN